MENKPDDILAPASRLPLLPLVVLLLVLAFSLATKLGLEEEQRLADNGAGDDDPIAHWLGNSRRLFAMSSYVKADAYLHSGYYPTIFDNNQAFKTPHMAEDTGAVASHNSGEETAFMGPPRDWLDAFSRHFIPNRHTHLDQGGPTDDLSKSSEVREILPWLELSSKLDPEDIRTYLVMAFWLRTSLHQDAEAEQVLREGLRNNPGNPQLLFDLGRIYFDDYHNPARARTIWEAALRTWAQEEPGVPQTERLKLSNGNFDDRFIFEQLQIHLAQLEGSLGNLDAAIAHLEQAKLASPKPEEIQKQIDELKNGKIHEQDFQH